MADEQSAGPSEPQGIEQQLDAGIAAQDRRPGDAEADMQSPDTERTDPDDTKESMRQAVAKSQEPLDT